MTLGSAVLREGLHRCVAGGLRPVARWLRSRRVALLCLALLTQVLAACASLPLPQRQAEFEQFTALIETHYYDPSFGGANWTALKNKYQAQLSNARTTAQLDRVMNQMLAELGRSHLKVLAPTHAARLAQSVQRSASVPAAAVPTLPAPKLALAGSSWLELKQFNLREALNFCADLRRAPAQSVVLVDLRGNPGGQVAVLQTLLGLFIDAPVAVGRLASRQGEQALRVWPQPFHYDGRIAVLVDDQSQSMAEIFAHAMQQSGRASVLGERTAGKVLVSRVYTLPGGRAVQIPVADFLDASGASLEGSGVAPSTLIDPENETAIRQVLAQLQRPELARSYKTETVREVGTRETVDALPMEGHGLIQKLGASLMPRPNPTSRLIEGRVTKRQGLNTYEGRFWLAQRADGPWTMGETLAGSGADAVEYRFGRDQEGFWTQHSTTGFQRRLNSERALYPVIPLMPINSAAEARESFAPTLSYAGIAERPDSTIGHLIETLDGRKLKIRIDGKSGALLQRGETQYSEFVAQNGALLPRVVETLDVVAQSAGVVSSADPMSSRYVVESVRYGEAVPAALLGPQANCFTMP